MKTNCKIIEDLLPLYIDEVCSDESKRFVEEHLEECDACSAKLKAQKAEIKVDKEKIEQNLKAKDPFKKIKRVQSYSKVGAVLGALIGLVSSLVFGSFEQPILGNIGADIGAGAGLGTVIGWLIQSKK
ncbi:MAG: zf-HC2 domain-containing protein [Planctomycetota bacterium]|jgi:predicted anti-sigma-YlaC factor YlaD